MRQQNYPGTGGSRLSLSPLLLALLSVLMPSARAAEDSGLFDLGQLNDQSGITDAWAVNDAGDVVVGALEEMSGDRFFQRAYRWTPEQGMMDLGSLNGGGSASAYDVNAKGDVVVGAAADGNFPLPVGGNPVYTQHAFRWTPTDGMVSLGTLTGDSSSSALGVNAGGDVVVGRAGEILVNANDGGNQQMQAFRWTQADGMVSLGTLPGHLFSGAEDVNDKGDVVVGFSSNLSYDSTNGFSGHTQAFRWTQDNGMVGLGSLNRKHSVASAVNAAGDVVVGNAKNDDGPPSAFRWTQATGMADLGHLNGGTGAVANAVNAAGDVVVGNAEDGNIIENNSLNAMVSHPLRAFRWTQATGMQSVEEWLDANGVAVNPNGPHTRWGTGVNADGSVVVGSLDNGHAFIARAAGLIDSVEFQQSLAASTNVAAPLTQDTDQIMHGAHGSPMRGLLEGGKQSLWVAGDWGRADHKQNDGNLGGGEFGYGLGITSKIMAKLALGGTYAQQNTVFGGNTRMDGIYVMPEMIANFSGTPFYATLSAYYNSGNADIERGYLNAGNSTVSKGRADTRVAAFRARLDWLDALKFSDTALTPYTSFTYANTRIDGYSETGGGFPVYWARRSEETTELRYGLDAVHRLTDSFNLLGRVEGVHRFEDHGTHARGQILGLHAFDFNGRSYQQDWLRTSLGVEGSFGDYGTATVTFNGTSEGPSPSYWLAASYRWNF